jgi:hypothetical protein
MFLKRLTEVLLLIVNLTLLLDIIKEAGYDPSMRRHVLPHLLNKKYQTSNSNIVLFLQRCSPLFIIAEDN